MATQREEVGTGVTITTTAGLSVNVIGAPSHSFGGRAAVEVSTHATTAGKPFCPGRNYDPGTLTVPIAWTKSSGTAVHAEMSGALKTFTITGPAPSASTAAAGQIMSVSGFGTTYEWSSPYEDRATGSLEVKLSGNITWTSGTT